MTLRKGLEKSRNTVTVRVGQFAGTPKVTETIRRFGINDKFNPCCECEKTKLGFDTDFCQAESEPSVPTSGGCCELIGQFMETCVT